MKALTERSSMTTMNCIYRPLADTELRSYFSLWNSILEKISYFPYLAGRKFRWSSSFYSRIGHIVLICSKKKMLRIAASRIVASVQYKKWVWIESVNNEPKNPRSDECFSTSDSYISVTSANAGSLPRPAFIFTTNVHLRPESGYFRFRQFFEWKWFGLHWRILSKPWI